MHSWMAWLEGSALGQLMRGSGPWTYAWVNLAHVLGVATLFGSILVLDLRLLGVERRLPLGPLSSFVTAVAASGFTLAICSGLALLATNATEYADNPLLIVKFGAIALGLVNIGVLKRLPAWKDRAGDLSRGQKRQLALAGGISLTSWLTAIAAGRMIGYW